MHQNCVRRRPAAMAAMRAGPDGTAMGSDAATGAGAAPSGSAKPVSELSSAPGGAAAGAGPAAAMPARTCGSGRQLGPV